MQDALQEIIQNKPGGAEETRDSSGKKAYHAFIFVYNSADRDSFLKLLKIIKSVVAFEESYSKGREDDDSLHAWMYVLGSKKYLKPPSQVLTEQDLVDLQELNSHDKIDLKEVSALTAYGIKDVFD